MKQQNWILINEDLLNFLRKFEKRIPFTNYGENKIKPFFGILFETNNLYYVTQISSPKPRHKTMHEQKDFKKIFDNIDGRLLGVINLNYMFPIPKNEFIKLEYKSIGKLRTFKDENEKSKYIYFLRKQLKIINNMNIDIAAKQIYDLKLKNPNDTISKRCFDFILLEQKCEEWIKNSN